MIRTKLATVHDTTRARSRRFTPEFNMYSSIPANNGIDAASHPYVRSRELTWNSRVHPDSRRLTRESRKSLRKSQRILIDFLRVMILEALATSRSFNYLKLLSFECRLSSLSLGRFLCEIRNCYARRLIRRLREIRISKCPIHDTKGG